MKSSDKDDAFTDNDEVEVDTFLGVGNRLDDRLAQEEPEVDRPRDDIPYDRSPGGVGQIVAEPDDDDPEDLPGEQQSILARSEGRPRRDAAPEETAMHYADGYEDADLYSGDGDYSRDDDHDDEESTAEKRDDSASEFAFDEEEEDELA